MTDKPNYRITIRPEGNRGNIRLWSYYNWLINDPGRVFRVFTLIAVYTPGHHPDSSKHPSKLKKV